mmetsp:Transcript_26620/g.42652  ORF Transcript_26620/g.42652 Transcript_26620/m.42652 type:complete len:314 (-) Transcript_26620:246-1187(-)
MYGICAFSTRQGLFRISSVASGSSFFSSFFSSPSFFSPASLEASVLSSAMGASFGAAELAAAAACSSTSIISLPKSLAATDSVAMDPTTVVPGVAATDTASKPLMDEAPSAMEPTMEPTIDALSSMSTSAVFFSSLSFSFFSLSCLALAEVDRTAVAALIVSSFLAGCSGSGYAKSDGLALDFTEKFFGILSLSLTPIRAFGVRVRENMWIKGNQYHICVKRQKPMAAPRRNTPDLEKSEAQELRPPASMMPFARMAPKRVITSSCLSAMTFCSLSRNSLTRSVLPGEVCMYRRPMAIIAPCLTKSEVSDIKG